MRSLPAADHSNRWPQVVAGSKRLDLQGVPEMSAYRAISDLRSAFDLAQSSIDRHHPADGEWMARSALCRHLAHVVDSWVSGMPVADDLPQSSDSKSLSRLAHEAHRLRLENERLRAAINSITGALEALKS